MIKNILLAITIITIFNVPAYSQKSQELIEQVGKIYTESDTSGNGLMGGFSLWGLVGGIAFGSIGFVALVYGKRSAKFRPILMGIALMACPYFLRGTIALYLVGTALTAALYFFRE